VTNRKSIQHIIENVSSIPTLPTVIAQMSQLLLNPKTSAEEIGKAITADQALASKVLKLVNSAFYGFPGRISTITHAIVILGFSTIKNIVLTASIFDAFKKKENSGNFDFEQFWIHSIACGAAAQAIAKFIGNKDKDECFIAGLIHDLGKIILFHCLPESFVETLALAQQNEILFYQSELMLFDITHQEIGGFLTENWNLPTKLQDAVKFHHDPSLSKDHYTTTSIVHCADIMVRALDFGNGGDSKIPAMSKVVWNELGLENIKLHALFDTIVDEIEKATVFIQLS
jgi:HD-like signal output (HDOD) protein